MSDDLKVVDRLRKRLHELGFGDLAEGISQQSHGQWPASKTLTPVVDALADEIERLGRVLKVEAKKYDGMFEFAGEQEAELERLREQLRRSAEHGVVKAARDTHVRVLMPVGVFREHHRPFDEGETDG